MKNLPILLLIVFLPTVLYAQKTKLKKAYYYNTKVAKEKYEVLKKNKYIKHGLYQSYYESGALKWIGVYEQNKRIGIWRKFNEKGEKRRITEYENGRKVLDKKVGIWEEYLEGGQVMKRFDYDKNEALKTIINVQIGYPAKAREQGVEGEVVVLVAVDENCELKESRILKSVSKECDEEALESIVELVRLMKKYDQKNCKELNRQIPISFKLE